MLRKRFKDLKATGALPSPPGVGMEILAITQNENCSVDEIAGVIQSDPALTGRLLQLANSALIGSTRPCTTIREATMRLGLRSVRSVALGFSLVAAHRSGACEAFEYGLFWSQSLARAVAAHALALRFHAGVPAESFVAALLSDIGSLALATVHSREYAQILRACDRREVSKRAQLEQDRFGIDHREVTAAMLRDWRLPEPFEIAAIEVDSVDLPSAEGIPPSLAQTVWIAARFAAAFVMSDDRPHDWEKVQRALACLTPWTPSEIVSLWSGMTESWRSWGRLFDIVTLNVPAFGLGAPPRTQFGDPRSRTPLPR